MANPTWVDDLLRSSAGPYRPGPGVSGAAAGNATSDAPDVEGYIRGAAAKRGIDPDVAVRVAQSEGGLVPNRTGAFPTGKSFWPFQLHYGGAGTPYASYGTVAGMGNAFTAQTGWQPGDPNAWQAATDYALDQARQSGWGQWYGARNQGITGFQGIGNAGREPPGGVVGSGSPAPGAAVAAPEAGGAPPWVRDLLSAGYTGGSVQPLPNEPRAGTGRGRVEALPNPPPGAPSWVLDLLKQPGYTGSSAGPSSAGRAGGSYAGPAQTDEVWPVAGHQWGQVNNPFGGVQSRSAGATVALPSSNVGADLTAGYGDAVVAPVSGTIEQVYDATAEHNPNENAGWGGSTLLRGDNGYSYRLSHAAPGSIATRPGQRVQQGQLLQRVGVSGNSTGPHLDAEKFDRPGHFVDITAGGAGSASAAPRGATGTAASGMPAWVRDLLGP